MEPPAAPRADLGGGSGRLHGAWPRGSLVLQLDLIDLGLPASASAAAAAQAPRGQLREQHHQQPARPTGPFAGDRSAQPDGDGGRESRPLPPHLELLLPSVLLRSRPTVQPTAAQRTAGRDDAVGDGGGGGEGGCSGGRRRRAAAPEGCTAERRGPLGDLLLAERWQHPSARDNDLQHQRQRQQQQQQQRQQQYQDQDQDQDQQQRQWPVRAAAAAAPEDGGEPLQVLREPRALSHPRLALLALGPPSGREREEAYPGAPESALTPQPQRPMQRRMQLTLGPTLPLPPPPPSPSADGCHKASEEELLPSLPTPQPRTPSRPGCTLLQLCDAAERDGAPDPAAAAAASGVAADAPPGAPPQVNLGDGGGGGRGEDGSGEQAGGCRGLLVPYVSANGPTDDGCTSSGDGAGDAAAANAARQRARLQGGTRALSAAVAWRSSRARARRGSPLRRRVPEDPAQPLPPAPSEQEAPGLGAPASWGPVEAGGGGGGPLRLALTSGDRRYGGRELPSRWGPGRRGAADAGALAAASVPAAAAAAAATASGATDVAAMGSEAVEHRHPQPQQQQPQQQQPLSPQQRPFVAVLPRHPRRGPAHCDQAFGCDSSLQLVTMAASGGPDAANENGGGLAVGPAAGDRRRQSLLDDDYLDQLWRALRRRRSSETTTGLDAAAAMTARSQSGQYGRPVEAWHEEQQLMEALRSLSEEYGGGHGGGAAAAAAAGEDGGMRSGGGAPGASPAVKELTAALRARARWQAAATAAGGAVMEDVQPLRRRWCRLPEECPSSEHILEPDTSAAPTAASVFICSPGKTALASYSSMYSRVVSSSVENRAAATAAAPAAAAAVPSRAAVDAACGAAGIGDGLYHRCPGPSSRRQRRHRQGRSLVVSSGCLYDVFLSGEVTTATAVRGPRDGAQARGGRGSAVYGGGASWTASDTLTAAAAAADADDTTSAASPGDLVGRASDADVGGADGDDASLSYNPVLLQRASSEEIRQAALLSAAAAAASSCWQHYLDHNDGIGGGDDGGAAGPAVDAHAGDVRNGSVPLTDAAPGSRAATWRRAPSTPAALMDTSSPFTALSAAAMAPVAPAVDPAAAAPMPGRLLPLVAVASESRVMLQPVAFVPPRSSTEHIVFVVHGLPAVWAARTAAAWASPPSVPPAGSGCSLSADWGSGHVATPVVVAAAAEAAAAGLRSAWASAGDDAGEDASGDAGVAVEVAVRSAGRYLPVEWRWLGAGGAEGVGVGGGPYASAGPVAEAVAAPAALELSVCGVLGQGLLVVEVWFRGELYAFLPAVSSHDRRLVLELCGETPRDRPRRDGGNGGGGAAATWPAAEPLPEDMLYDLGTWLQYIALVPPPPLPPLNPGPQATGAAELLGAAQGSQLPTSLVPSHNQEQQQQQRSERPFSSQGGEGGEVAGAASQDSRTRSAAPSLPPSPLPSPADALAPLRNAVRRGRHPSAGDHTTPPPLPPPPPRHLDSAAAIHGSGGGGLMVSPTMLQHRQQQQQQQHSLRQIAAAHAHVHGRQLSSGSGLAATAATAAGTAAPPRSRTGSLEARTLSYNFSEIMGPLALPPPLQLLPQVLYTESVEPGILAASPDMLGTNFLSSAAGPRTISGLTSAATVGAATMAPLPFPSSLSFSSHAALVPMFAASEPTAGGPAAAATASVGSGSGGLAPPGSAAATLPPPALDGQSSLPAGSTAASAAADGVISCPNVNAAALSPLSAASSLTAGSSLTAAGSTTAVAAVVSRLRAFQDSAVDITVPILPGSLDLASAVSELQRRPEYGQSMQDMAIGLLAWLCLAGRPVTAGAVLSGLLRHRGMRFFDVCTEVRRLAEYKGMSLLHLAVQSGRVAMVAAVAEWTQTHGSVLAWDEFCDAGVAPIHQAAALVVVTRESAGAAQQEGMLDGSSAIGAGGGSGGSGSSWRIDEEGLKTLTWLLRRFPAARRMWSTARDAYGSTAGAVLSYHLAALPPAAAAPVWVALAPLVGPQELWAMTPPPPPSPSPPTAPPLRPGSRGGNLQQTGGLSWVGRLLAALARWCLAGGHATSTSTADEPTAVGVALLVVALCGLLFSAMAAA